MDESILTSVKKFCGIDEDDTSFDADIIMFINTELTVLNDIGVGNEILITDSSTEWSEFLNGDSKLLGAAQYVWIRVKLMFDPPQSGSAVEQMKAKAAELEWRLYHRAEDGI